MGTCSVRKKIDCRAGSAFLFFVHRPEREARRAANLSARAFFRNAREVEENAKRNYSGGEVFNLIDAEVRKRRKAVKERL
jgi:hypothetical protein